MFLIEKKNQSFMNNVYIDSTKSFTLKLLSIFDNFSS